MNLSEEREEGLPPSKTTLSGEHDSQTKAESPVQQERPDSPVPSCVSLKSDLSISEPLNFGDGNHSTEQRVQQERPDSPVPSCVSMKSDQSMEPPIAIKDRHHSTEQKQEKQMSIVHQEKSEVPSGQPAQENQTDLASIFMALQSPNGHLDLFLRFLLGLSLQTNQTLLRGLLKQVGSNSQTNQETVQYIKDKIRENPSPERSINLFHCLNELNDRSLVEGIQQYLRSGSLSTEKLSPLHLTVIRKRAGRV
ncbi:uncharacterized protein [Centroberyx affinis]|uniref:uncharacterized protein n=1 Tax=Centroberyx affinis TaxID=166261 RepID=UPI003A5BC28E